MKKEFKLPKISAIKKVFVAMTNTDLTEGRGEEYAFCVCENKSTAIRMGKGRCVQGSDCRIVETDAFYVYGAGWFVPGGFVYKPTNEDMINEEKLKKEEATKTLIDRFEKNEPINENERQVILKLLKGNS